MVNDPARPGVGTPIPPGAPFGPSLGFVVAMRSHSIGAAPSLGEEWLVVARWGPEGQYLSISWTDIAADAAEAPILLTPKRTVIGLRCERTRPQITAFRLVRAVPEGTTAGGTFIPAEGYALLYGANSGLRLRCKASATDRDAAARWNLQATGATWIGEFVEKRSQG